jgi:hypothetical protein
MSAPESAPSKDPDRGKTSESLVQFLYLLARDELAFGVIERVLMDVEKAAGKSVAFSEPRMAEYAASLATRLVGTIDAHKTTAGLDLDAMVDRFLAWPLPASVCSDLCVTYVDYPHSRSGTNLLTAAEARAMLGYVIGVAPPILGERALLESARGALRNAGPVTRELVASRIDAALAVETGDELPDQLLDVNAICDQRDALLAFVNVADELLREAPIHHFGKEYEIWRDARERYFKKRRAVKTSGEQT